MGARTKGEDELRQTAGVSDDAEKIETPMMKPAGPRDALIDPQPEDFIPDVETKGYHVGMVRQPAEVVGVGGVPQGFRSTAGEPSRFAHGSLAHLKAAHRENDPAGADVQEVGPDPTPAGVFMPGVGFVTEADARKSAAAKKTAAEA
jgi:hypothetical protein